MLGIVCYRTAWFLAHRVREAITDKNPAPLKGKTVEADEVYIGKPEQVFKCGRGWVDKRGHETKRKVLTRVGGVPSARRIAVSRRCAISSGDISSFSSLMRLSP
jgi:hypothetical protein